eukprot:133552_1
MSDISALRRQATPLVFHKEQSYDYSLIAPPKSPFARVRMSSSCKRLSESESCSKNVISYFENTGYSGDITATDSTKPAEFKIVDRNPYDDMFRRSINECKKCHGNGILLSKLSHEPQICPKCEGHGYDNDDITIDAINTCGRCSIM